MIVEALYDFKGDLAGKQLSFLRRELLKVTDTCPNGWAKGFKLGEEQNVGYFPIKYVKEKNIAQAVKSVMFIHEVKYKYETKQFSVEPGERLVSLSAPKEGWIYCMRLEDGKRGYVPEKYVQNDEMLCATGRCRKAFSGVDGSYLSLEEGDEVSLIYEISKDFAFCSNRSAEKVSVPFELYRP